MIEYRDVQRSDGKIFRNIPISQFILNEDQQFAVVGLTMDNHGGYDEFREEKEGIEDAYMGTLEDQNPIFQSQIINSLENVEWDFSKYPNPTIILLTKNSIAK